MTSYFWIGGSYDDGSWTWIDGSQMEMGTPFWGRVSSIMQIIQCTFCMLSCAWILILLLILLLLHIFLFSMTWYWKTILPKLQMNGVSSIR